MSEMSQAQATAVANGETQTWGALSIAAMSDTRYLGPGYDAATVTTTAIGFRAARAGTYRNMRVRHNSASGNGNSVSYRLRVNGVDSALTVTLATGAIGQASNLVNTVIIAANDLIELVAVKAAAIGAGGVDVIVSAEFV